MSHKRKKNQQEQLWTETMSAIQDLEEVLKKSAPDFGKEKEEDKEESEEKKDKKGSEESEKPEDKEEMEKGMEDDAIEGDIPETVKSEESVAPEADLSSLLEGKSAEELLSLISSAIAKVEELGLPERSEEDAQQAEHEISEIQEDAVAAQPEEEQALDKSPAEASGSIESLDPVFGEKEIPWLENLHSKLGEHLASRKEMEKAAHVEQPKAVMPEATAMMKAMESMKKSFEDTLSALTAQNKALASEMKDMKKSYVSLKDSVDGIPATTYASPNTGNNAKELAKSFQNVEPAREMIDGLTLSKKLAHAQRTDSRITTQLISKAGFAKSYDQVSFVLKTLDDLGIKVD